MVRYLSVPFVMLGCWSLITDKSWSARILSLSFPIYLLHMFFVDVCNCIGLKGDGRLTIYLLLIKYVICVFGAAFVAMSLRRFTPRFATLMFGGR